MEHIINKVIEIDQKASNVKEKTEKIIRNNEATLKKALGTLEDQALEEAKENGIERYEIHIKEGELEKEKIISEAERECEALEKKFLEVYEALTKEMFYEIF